MGVIYKSDLFEANGSSIVGAIETCSSNAKRLSDAINSFIVESKNELQGGGYDAVRKKLMLYIDALNKQTIICDTLVSSIKSSNKQMMSYMQDYSKLDDSRVYLIEKELANAQSKLNWLESYTIIEKDENDSDSEEERIRNGSSSEIEQYRTLIDVLSKELELLKGLETASNSAWGSMSGISNDISSYCNAVNSITPTIF